MHGEGEVLERDDSVLRPVWLSVKPVGSEETLVKEDIEHNCLDRDPDDSKEMVKEPQSMSAGELDPIPDPGAEGAGESPRIANAKDAEANDVLFQDGI